MSAKKSAILISVYNKECVFISVIKRLESVLLFNKKESIIKYSPKYDSKTLDYLRM